MEDEDACRTMGELGLTLLEPGIGILTHCNAGALATVDYGTTLDAGEGANEGLTAQAVGAVVFDTANALVAVLNAGHATNCARLL